MLMRLPCKHGHFAGHWINKYPYEKPTDDYAPGTTPSCPGGTVPTRAELIEALGPPNLQAMKEVLAIPDDSGAFFEWHSDGQLTEAYGAALEEDAC